MNRGSAVHVAPPRDCSPRPARRPAGPRFGDGPGAHGARGRPAGERAGDASWRPIGRLHRACAEACPDRAGREGAGAASVAPPRRRWAAAGGCRTRLRHCGVGGRLWASARRGPPAWRCSETLRRRTARSRGRRCLHRLARPSRAFRPPRLRFSCLPPLAPLWAFPPPLRLRLGRETPSRSSSSSSWSSSG